MPLANLFIDTNVLLNFYSFADDDLEQLESLIGELNSGGVCLHIPQQVVNELARNREAKLKAATDQFSKEALPTAVPRHMQAYPQHIDYVKAIETAKKLRGQLVGLALADASNQTLKTDVLLKELFDKAKIYPENDEVFALAVQRLQKGNPPGKNGSVGDQYNWEVLLKKVPGEDLHIVSRDGDYASLLNKSRPHPSLESEWRRKKGGTLHIYPELRSFLKRYGEMSTQAAIVAVAEQTASYETVVISPPIPTPPIPNPPPPAPPLVNSLPPSNPAKDQAIQLLINSGSFSTTHLAVNRLEKFKGQFTKSDAEALISAAVNNDQIRWIASDSDVFSFFASLLTEHADINSDLFDEAADVFGLRPDPPDPYDD